MPEQIIRHRPDRTRGHDLTVVSNRLPISVHCAPGEEPVIEPSSGGLVSALQPVLQEVGGQWIGWSGTSAEHESGDVVDAIRETETAYELAPVPLYDHELASFYDQTCNSVIWPVLHSMLHRADLSVLDWQSYQHVNRRFAREIVATIPGQVWIHDYHLFSAARHVRQILSEKETGEAAACPPLGFFLHIPFPRPTVLRMLPVATQLLEDLLQHDLVAVQTERDLLCLVRCLEDLLPSDTFTSQRRDGRYVLELENGRQCVLAALPIGIDGDEFRDRAASAETELELAQLRRELDGRDLFLSVDRLDYTKGLDIRLEAIEAFLERFPERAGTFEFHQIAVPTRTRVPAYRAYGERVRRLAEEINSRWRRDDWQPVFLHEDSVSPHRLTALYRAARVLLVTPHRDGMNLVAKEYCVCQPGDQPGSLVLGSGAGAATQLRVAVTVNGDHCDSVLEGLIRALDAPATQRAETMHELRRTVLRHDVHQWSQSFLALLGQARHASTARQTHAMVVDAS